MPLTDSAIRSLKPREKPYKRSDAKGLFILVAPSGSLLWRFKYRIDGKEKLLSIGPYPDVTLAEARAEREAARALLLAGKDPSFVKQDRTQEEREQRGHTFEKQALEYLDKGRKEKLAETTMSKNTWLLNMAIAEFGSRPVSEITAPMVLRCLRKIEAKGNYATARRLRGVIGSVFRYAIANGAATTDPTYALRDALVRSRSEPRAAITDPKIFGELLRAIDDYHGQVVTRMGLQLLALLATRPGELRLARWEEFDFEKREWMIPWERTKMRRPHRMPLSGRVIEILQSLRELTGSTGFLLPSMGSSKKEKVMSENTLNTALRRMGFGAEEMTSHGFRASFSTLANESGLWNPDAIEQAIAHVEGSTMRKLYNRGKYYEERVRLAEWWAEYTEELKRKAYPRK